ncbi:MAG: cytochrome c oxidase subunit 3 [Bacteroidota bacterium]|nr:cytochrome c oxidase subunit 3 [Bacteroidota bacterium]
MLEEATQEKAWEGGDKPFAASYGKLMMWFFLITDALTFSAFLASYGFSRFKYDTSWPVPEDVFTHFPFLHGDHPLLFVALMTFILIMSSVTMVLAVNYGHAMKKNKVILWLVLTIVGGATFLGSQAWEWGHFIHGDKGAIVTHKSEIIHLVKGNHIFSVDELMQIEDPHEHHAHEINFQDFKSQFSKQPELTLRLSDKTILEHEKARNYLDIYGSHIIRGANLYENEYGHSLFGDYFFFITGFHGFHVFSGVIILIIILINVIKGTYERRGHYEMVEKVGLYWHFVDLVWVFVFTFFYLV